MIIADDSQEVLEEMRSLLETEFQVVAAAGTASELLRVAREFAPDCIVTDLQMPGQSGMEAACQALRDGVCDTVVILTMVNSVELAQFAMRSGIRAYVLKEDAGLELIPAIHAALSGGQYLSRGVDSVRSRDR